MATITSMVGLKGIMIGIGVINLLIGIVIGYGIRRFQEEQLNQKNQRVKEKE